jgi:dCTP deaminase
LPSVLALDTLRANASEPIMILSDRDIRARLQSGDLRIAPLKDEALQIQPASVDLRLGHEFLFYVKGRVPYLDPLDRQSIDAAVERTVVLEGDALVLEPGAFTLGTTIEEVALPDDLVARVDGRSSVGRLAVVVHATAGFIDPGFVGQITLELSNIGPLPVKLYPGMRIAQVAFYPMSSPAERPYGEQRGSHYQGQRGPQPSRIKLDG